MCISLSLMLHACLCPYVYECLPYVNVSLMLVVSLMSVALVYVHVQEYVVYVRFITHVAEYVTYMHECVSYVRCIACVHEGITYVHRDIAYV